jgi:hypothetical protein
MHQLKITGSVGSQKKERCISCGFALGRKQMNASVSKRALVQI